MQRHRNRNYGCDDVASPIDDVENGAFNRGRLLTLNGLPKLRGGSEILGGGYQRSSELPQEDQPQRELEDDMHPVGFAGPMKGCGRWGGHFRAPPEGKCGSHTFSLLDAAARGIRVERENAAELKLGQITNCGIEGLGRASEQRLGRDCWCSIGNCGKNRSAISVKD
jgi:hypothetical protein